MCHKCCEMDETFAKLGDFGRYQRMAFILLCLVGLPIGFHEYTPVFWGATPEKCCGVTPGNSITRNASDVLNSTSPVRKTREGHPLPCSPANDLQRRSVDVAMDTTNASDQAEAASGPRRPCSTLCRDVTSSGDTVVSQWTLVCQDQWKVTLVQVAFALGQALGACVIGIVADRHGRRSCLLVCTAMQITLSFLSILTPEVYSFATVRMLVGISVSGLFVLSFVLVSEMFNGSWRVLACMVLLAAPCVSADVLACVASVIQHRHYLSLTLALLTLPLLLYFRFIQESVRWAVAATQPDLARNLINNIAYINNMDLEDITLPDIQMKKAPSCPWKHISSARRVRFKIVALLYSGLVFGLITKMPERLEAMPLTSISGRLAAWSTIHLASLALALLLGYHCSRRPVIVVFLVMTGLCLECTAPVPQELSTLDMTLKVIAVVLMTSCQALFLIFIVEFLPTTVRATSVGIVHSATSVGIIIETLMHATNFNGSVASVVRGGACLVASLLLMFLPDTWRSKFPEAITDTDDLCRKHDMYCLFTKAMPPVRPFQINGLLLPPSRHPSERRNTIAVPYEPQRPLADTRTRNSCVWEILNDSTDQSPKF